MNILIHYRCDREEYICTDSNTINVDSWEEVLNEVTQIESCGGF